MVAKEAQVRARGRPPASSGRRFSYQLKLPAALDAEIEAWQKSQLFDTPKSAVLLKAIELGLPLLREAAERLPKAPGNKDD